MYVYIYICICIHVHTTTHRRTTTKPHTDLHTRAYTHTRTHTLSHTCISIQLLSSVRSLPTLLKHAHGIRAIILDCVRPPPRPPIVSSYRSNLLTLVAPLKPKMGLSSVGSGSVCTIAGRPLDPQTESHLYPPSPPSATPRHAQLSTLQWFDKSSDVRAHRDATPSMLLDCALGVIHAVANEHKLVVLASRWAGLSPPLVFSLLSLLLFHFSLCISLTHVHALALSVYRSPCLWLSVTCERPLTNLSTCMYTCRV